MIYKLLILMMIGHILGDFYFQTDKIASEKDKNFKGVMTHAVEYTLYNRYNKMFFIKMEIC